MKKYSEYKDSGVEWIGEIPSHWNVKKLKFTSDLNNTKLDNSKFNEYIGLEHVQSFSGKLLHYGNSSELDSKVNSVFYKNNVLFGKLRPYLTKCIVAETDGVCSDEFLVLKPNEIKPKFLQYIMLSKLFIELVNSSTYGAKMPRASWDFIGNIEISYPSIDEQIKITNYLDSKISQMEELISKKEELIETLKVSKTKLISETVTKGLDKHVPMKDSGIEWIGEIPSHWELKKIKHCIDSNIGGFWGEDPKGNENDVSCIRVSEFIKEKCLLKDVELTIRNIPKNKFNQIKVKKGSILIEKSGGGETCLVGNAVIVNDNLNAVYSNFITKIEVKNTLNPFFINYMLRCMYLKGVNYLCINQTTGIQNLNTSKYLSEYISIPSKYEQDKIVNFLDKKTSQIDSLVEKVKEQIELLKEAKQKLITEVVTGKIDVTDL